MYYCTDLSQNGHQQPEGTTTVPLASVSGDEGSLGLPTPTPVPVEPPAEDPEVAASRCRVIEGNRAWRAAAEVRHRWLAGQLFARRSAPREVDVFVATQLLTMPEVPRRYLSSAGISSAFAGVTGQQPLQMVEASATAASRKLLLMLAPVVAAYEHALMTAAGSHDTWQDSQFSPCPYADAGTYLAFLASIGYQLSSYARSPGHGGDQRAT